jgi:hypothetical protein
MRESKMLHARNTLCWFLVPVLVLISGSKAKAQFAVPPDADAVPTRAQLQAVDDELVATARKTLERRLRFKLDFLRRAVSASEERDAQIRRVGQTLVSTRLNEIEDWVRATHQLSPSVLTLAGLSNRSMEDELEQEVRAVLGDDVFAKYAAERRAADARLALARFRNWVAAIDKKLLLSSEQREQLLRIIAANWRRGRPPPRANAIFYGDMLQFVGPGCRSRSLPELADLNWIGILRPAQRAVWAESQQHPRPAAQMHRVRRAAERMPKDDLAEEELDDQAPKQPAQAQREADRKANAHHQALERLAVQWLVGRARAATVLTLRIDDIQLAAPLSEAQRHKLELAGMLDAERYEARVDATLMKMVEAQIDHDQGFRFEPDELRLLQAPSLAIADEHSAFRKLLAKTLLPEQTQRLAEVERSRKDFAEEAACECVAALVAERLPLTDAQWSGFSKLLMDHPEALGDTSIEASEIAARLPAELVRPPFDDDQWELVAPLFGPALPDEAP